MDISDGNLCNNLILDKNFDASVFDTFKGIFYLCYQMVGDFVGIFFDHTIKLSIFWHFLTKNETYSLVFKVKVDILLIAVNLSYF